MSEATTPQDREAARRRWFRWVVILLLVLGTYRIVIWLLLRSVDEGHLHERLEEWGHSELCADVRIGGMDVDLDLFGQAEVTARDLQVDHPNVIVPGQFFRADDISFSCPIWGAWGFRVKPRGRIHKARMVFAWDEEHESNLIGLCRPKAAGLPQVACPLARVNARTLFMDVEASEIEITRPLPQVSVSVDVGGALAFDTRKRKLWGALRATAIRHRPHGKEWQLLPAKLSVQQFIYRGPKRGGAYALTRLQASADAMPVALVRAVLPRLPAVPTTVLGSGSVDLRQGYLALEGTLQGLDLPALGMGKSVAVKARYRLAPTVPAKASEEPALTLTAQTAGKLQTDLQAFRDAQGQWQRLVVRATDLDLGAIPPRAVGMPTWITDLMSGLETIELEAARVRYDGLPVWLRSPGGSGRLQATVRRTPERASEDESLGPAWTMVLQLQDVSLPLQGSGRLLRALAALPQAGREVEILRHRSLNLPPLPPEDRPLVLDPLRFQRLEIRCDIFADGVIRLFLQGKSPDFGHLAGGGRLARDEKGRLTGRATLCLREVPQRIFRGPSLVSSEVLAALARQAATGVGLRLDVTLSTEGATIEHRYVQDVFMVWTEMRGQKDRGED